MHGGESACQGACATSAGWNHQLTLYLVLEFLAVVVLTSAMRHYALAHGVMDEPNERSAHSVPTPRGGGVAFVISFISLLCLLFIWGPSSLAPPTDLFVTILVAGSAVAWIGFLDDHGDISVRYRFIVHILAAAMACSIMDVPTLPAGVVPPWLSALWLPFIALSIVWILNLFNFMDGIDGIASVEAITVTAGAALILYIVGAENRALFWPLVLAAGVAGFLVWNWPPARIFMGDSASGFLGFTISVLALSTSADSGISLWSWLILMAIFLVDASWTLMRRILSGQRWYEAHASHAYQIMARRRIEMATTGPDQADVNAIRSSAHLWVIRRVAAINLLWLLPLAIGASVFPVWAPLIGGVAVLPLLAIVARTGAGGRFR